MKKFYEKRQKHRRVVTTVLGNQVPVYGGLSFIGGAKDNHENLAVPLNLTFVMRSRAYILGKLVKSKFYRRITCSVTLRSSKLGKPSNLTNSCTYRWILHLFMWSPDFGHFWCHQLYPKMLRNTDIGFHSYL